MSGPFENEANDLHAWTEAVLAYEAALRALEAFYTEGEHFAD